MEIAYNLLKFVHVLGVVFMAAPLYALVIVGERMRFSPTMIYSVDKYMENLIRGQARRCYVFQLTVFASGVLLVNFNGLGWSALYTNPVLIIKMLILLTLISSLTYITLVLQAGIDRLLAPITADPVPAEVATKIKTLRLRRKRLAAFCLFLVISAVILGLQVFSLFNPYVIAGLLALAALFAWRAFKAPVPWGWW